MALFADPVPGRECGECNYCCQYLTIDTEEIQVKSGCLCSNWAEGKGCTIYETRPQVCGGYLCGWRMFAHFNDTWRPDKCGMIITPVKGKIPEPFLAEGIEFLIIKPELAITKPEFIEFLVSGIEAKIPLFLSLRGPIGHSPSRVFLNPALEEAVLKRDEPAFLLIFNALLQALKTAEFKPVIFEYGNFATPVKEKK